MEEIIEKKEQKRTKKWIPTIILIVVVIVLGIIGYVFSNKSMLLENETIPIVGNLDYQEPFGLFSELPIEEGVKIEESTLISYQGGDEIKTIQYKSSKSETEIFIDFFNYLENNGWIIENEVGNSFIYATKYPDSLNILIEKDKEENILVNISHTKLKTEETE